MDHRMYWYFNIGTVIALEAGYHELFASEQVTILFSNFSDEDRALPEAVPYRRDLNEYNRRYSGVPRPVSPNIHMHILLTVVLIFLMLLLGRI